MDHITIRPEAGHKCHCGHRDFPDTVAGANRISDGIPDTAAKDLVPAAALAEEGRPGVLDTFAPPTGRSPAFLSRRYTEAGRGTTTSPDLSVTATEYWISSRLLRTELSGTRNEMSPTTSDRSTSASSDDSS